MSRSITASAPATPAGLAHTMGRSLIRAVAEQAWKHPDVIRLELGEPGRDTPAHVIAAAYRAASEGATRYAPNAGLPELRSALAEKVRTVNGYPANPEHIVVGAGAVQVMFAALSTLVGPGDEVLLPDPSWPDYRMMCDLLGARAVYYRLAADSDYAPDTEDLAQRIGPHSRVLILNSPSNPLGSMHSAGRLAEIVALAAHAGLWVVSDECYDQLTFDGSFTSLCAIAPEERERIISVYSFSKVHAMTGWRVGYAVLPDSLVEPVTNAQEPLVSCVNTPAQHAAMAALTGPQDHIHEMREAFRARSELVGGLLDDAGVAHVHPRGTFYIWASLGEIARDSLSWSLALLAEEGVSVAPGEAFGPSGSGCVRLSLGQPHERLVDGVERLLRKVERDRARL